MSDETAMTTLEKVEHIVVLMLENRSFDHMLGYLSLEGGRGDVDGLRAEFANEHDGRSYPVHHLDSTAIADDPDHSGDAVELQIGGGGGMGGFVESFAKTLADRGVRDADPGRVMGYYNADDVPVYDHLAREFAICDRWFSSVPGATWPNRLYAICGRAAGSRDDLPRHLPPIYDKPSFVRHLDAHDISWRWYSFEAGTLRFADAHYVLGHHDRFAFFSHTNLNWKERIERIDVGAPSFLEDAATGALPSVAWIDPNFSNFNPIGFQPNDDHAPADIKDGQELVLAVYHALATGPQWEKTLLIVFYDEHGGFFDHVAPPEAPDDDPTMFGRYGVRVPALIVSPWIEPLTVSHTLFDHTSIIKTILLRFCPDALKKPKLRHGLPARLKRLGHPRYLGERVARANDLGELLARTEPRQAPDRYALVQDAAGRAAARPEGAAIDQDALANQPMTDLQIRIAAANRHLRLLGHPADRP